MFPGWGPTYVSTADRFAALAPLRVTKHYVEEFFRLRRGVTARREKGGKSFPREDPSAFDNRRARLFPEGTSLRGETSPKDGASAAKRLIRGCLGFVVCRGDRTVDGLAAFLDAYGVAAACAIMLVKA